jgi:hypothetical protein
VRLIVMVFAFAVGLVVVLLGNNPAAMGQETQARSPSAPPQLTTPLSEKELEPYKNKGTAAITGQAFIATGGGVMYSPGGSVTLVPATEYTKDWFRRYVLEDRQGYCGPDEIGHEIVKDECLNRLFASSLPPDKRINSYLKNGTSQPNRTLLVLEASGWEVFYCRSYHLGRRSSWGDNPRICGGRSR